MKPSERIMQIAKNLLNANYKGRSGRFVLSEFELIDHATMLYLDEEWAKLQPEKPRISNQKMQEDIERYKLAEKNGTLDQEFPKLKRL